MKTLILSDETYELMRKALGPSEDGRTVLRRFGREEELPSDRELVAMARRGDPAPAAIAVAVDRRNAGRQAATDTRESLEALLHHVHAAGVQPSVLMAWFEYNNSRLFQLLTAEKGRREASAV